MPLTSLDKFGITRRDKNYSKFDSVSSPSWVKTSVIYEVYLRSYSKDGDIVSFIKKLPEIKDLGINTIWLMPIHLIGHLKRKGPLGSPYAVRDYYRINPEYGTKDDFKELVRESHKLGIRMIMDFVSNHTANDHIETKNHPEWFMRDKNGEFTRQMAGWSDIIDLNYQSKELRHYMNEVATYWVKEFDIDGYRFDVAGLVPQDFWIDLRHELLKIKKDLLLLAEWEDPEMHLQTFDVTYDWMLYYKMDQIFNGSAAAQDAVDLLIKREQEFPRHALRLRFLENHDQARATYKFGSPSFMTFATFIFTIYGIPLIYNGQEVGDPKHLTLFDKTAINWKIKGANEIRRFYKALIDLRKTNSIFTEGTLSKIENNKPKQIVSFCRQLGDQTAIVVLNFSNKETPVMLKKEFDQSDWKTFNIRSLETTQMNLDKWRLKLKPYDGFIFISD